MPEESVAVHEAGACIRRLRWKIVSTVAGL